MSTQSTAAGAFLERVSPFMFLFRAGSRILFGGNWWQGAKRSQKKK
jgi:hypothetical protein